MSQVQQITMLNQRSFSGPAWHGPSVEQIVSDITAEQAAARPALGRFSIWQHILHMIFWKDKVTNVIKGAAMPRSSEVTMEENWPTVTDVSELAWNNTLFELRACEARLQDALANFPAARLQQTVKGRDYDFAFALYNVPCHDTYHAAQIVLLKKAFDAATSVEHV